MRFLNSIKIKILVVSIALAAIPVAIVSVLLGMQSSSAAKMALQNQVANQLISIREIKKSQVENHLKDIDKKMSAYSIDASIVTYMQKFSTYYQTDKRQLTDISDQKQNLVAFYNGPYAATYKKWNGINAPAADFIVSKLANIDIALQNSYLALNEADFGEKHNLINPEDGSTYANAHDEGHRVLQSLFEKLDVEDIYLVDPKGNIVYSVQKNPDFATNLREGPYKNSNLARAYVSAIDSEDYEHVAVSDIEPYAGNFNQPSMFFASPIQDLDEEDAFEILGVMVLKVKLKAINTIMNSNASWENIGMGKTGEVYLIGNDSALRSDARAMLEIKDKYLEDLAGINVKADLIKLIDLQATSSNRTKIENEVINLAISDATGTGIFDSPFGKETIAAYAPINFHELGWGIVSGIETSEAFAASEELVSEIKLSGLILTAVMISIAIVVGVLFSTMITRPIIKMSRTMREIEQTSDLTKRIEIKKKDELGTMAEAMNNMLEKFRYSLEQVAASTAMLTTSSEEMSAITQQTSANVNKQFGEIDQIATAINEMTATVQEVASNATNAAQAAATSSTQASSGKSIVESAMSAITDTSNELENVEQVI